MRWSAGRGPTSRTGRSEAPIRGSRSVVRIPAGRAQTLRARAPCALDLPVPPLLASPSEPARRSRKPSLDICIGMKHTRSHDARASVGYSRAARASRGVELAALHEWAGRAPGSLLEARTLADADCTYRAAPLLGAVPTSRFGWCPILRYVVLQLRLAR